MKEITLEQLLEAGCHFGHQVTRSNPRARDFIYEARDNIHIIDLAKTKEGLEHAGKFIKSLGEKEESKIIVVGTKRQARGIVEELFKKAKEDKAEAGLYTITNRWVGGLLTNFDEVSKNFKKLKDLQENLQNDEFRSKYTKKEIGLWKKDKEKLERLYGGVADLTQTPDALFIIDSHLEDLAVREAMRMGVTTVAIVDTNADPDIIDYPIPANDDAVGSIRLIVAYIVDSWIEGRSEGLRLKDEGLKKKDIERLGEAKEKKKEEEARTEKVEKTSKAKLKTQKSKTQVKTKKS